MCACVRNTPASEHAGLRASCARAEPGSRAWHRTATSGGKTGPRGPDSRRPRAGHSCSSACGSRPAAGRHPARYRARSRTGAPRAVRPRRPVHSRPQDRPGGRRTGQPSGSSPHGCDVARALDTVSSGCKWAAGERHASPAHEASQHATPERQFAARSPSRLRCVPHGSPLRVHPALRRAARADRHGARGRAAGHAGRAPPGRAARRSTPSPRRASIATRASRRSRSRTCTTGPTSRAGVGPEVIAAMTAIGREISRETGLPLGVQVLAGRQPRGARGRARVRRGVRARRGLRVRARRRRGPDRGLARASCCATGARSAPSACACSPTSRRSTPRTRSPPTCRSPRRRARPSSSSPTASS